MSEPPRAPDGVQPEAKPPVAVFSHRSSDGALYVLVSNGSQRLVLEVSNPASSSGWHLLTTWNVRAGWGWGEGNSGSWILYSGDDGSRVFADGVLSTPRWTNLRDGLPTPIDTFDAYPEGGDLWFLRLMVKSVDGARMASAFVQQGSRSLVAWKPEGLPPLLQSIIRIRPGLIATQDRGDSDENGVEDEWHFFARDGGAWRTLRAPSQPPAQLQVVSEDVIGMSAASKPTEWQWFVHQGGEQPFVPLRDALPGLPAGAVSDVKASSNDALIEVRITSSRLLPAEGNSRFYNRVEQTEPNYYLRHGDEFGRLHDVLPSNGTITISSARLLASGRLLVEEAAVADESGDELRAWWRHDALSPWVNLQSLLPEDAPRRFWDLKLTSTGHVLGILGTLTSDVDGDWRWYTLNEGNRTTRDRFAPMFARSENAPRGKVIDVQPISNDDNVIALRLEPSDADEPPVWAWYARSDGDDYTDIERLLRHPLPADLDRNRADSIKYRPEEGVLWLEDTTGALIEVFLDYQGSWVRITEFVQPARYTSRPAIDSSAQNPIRRAPSFPRRARSGSEAAPRGG